MHNCLAIDTSSQKAAIGLMADGQYYHAEIENSKAQAEQILNVIEQLLSQAKITKKSIDYIAIANGPGSFTGLRVGVSAAQALAYALNIPVVAVGSLQVLAEQAYRLHGLEQVLIAQDARMQEIYWGIFEHNDGVMQQIGEISVDSPEKAITKSGLTSITVRPEAPQCGVSKDKTVFLPGPEAIDLITLAEYKFNRGETLKSSELTPEYVRNKVAEKPKNI